VLVRLQLKSGANHNLFSTEIVKENIRNVFASYNCHLPDVEVVFEKPKVNQRSGKMARVIRDQTND